MIAGSNSTWRSPALPTARLIVDDNRLRAKAPLRESEGYDSAMRRLLLIAISAAGGLAGVTALLFAISNSGPTRHEQAYLSIRNEQSRIVIDVPTPDTTSRPARIESSFDIENAGDIAVSDVKATLTYELGQGWRMVTNTNAVEVGDLSPNTSRNVKVSTPVTVTLEALRAYQREQGENYSFYPTVKIKGSVSYIGGDATRRMKEWVSDLYAVRQGS
jgi:hypothetical protein